MHSVPGRNGSNSVSAGIADNLSKTGATSSSGSGFVYDPLKPLDGVAHLTCECIGNVHNQGIVYAMNTMEK